MSSCQPLPLTGQACELEMSFSLGEIVSFSSLPVSPRQCSAWPQACSTHTRASSALCSVPPPRQRGDIPSMYLATSLSRGGAISSPFVLEYVVPSQTVFCSPGRLADLLC
jgi:hypothetical protein